jgi:hypothetical protein
MVEYQSGPMIRATDYLKRETAINAFANLVLNVAIAAYLLQTEKYLSLWGPKGFVLDLAITVFLACFLSSLIMLKLARRNIARGKLIPPVVYQANGRDAWRALKIAGIGICCFYLPAATGLIAFADDPVPISFVIAAKGAISCAAGGIAGFLALSWLFRVPTG